MPFGIGPIEFVLIAAVNLLVLVVLVVLVVRVARWVVGRSDSDREIEQLRARVERLEANQRRPSDN